MPKNYFTVRGRLVSAPARARSVSPFAAVAEPWKTEPRRGQRRDRLPAAGLAGARSSRSRRSATGPRSECGRRVRLRARPAGSGTRRPSPWPGRRACRGRTGRSSCTREPGAGRAGGTRRSPSLPAARASGGRPAAHSARRASGTPSGSGGLLSHDSSVIQRDFPPSGRTVPARRAARRILVSLPRSGMATFSGSMRGLRRRAGRVGVVVDAVEARPGAAAGAPQRRRRAGRAARAGTAPGSSGCRRRPGRRRARCPRRSRGCRRRTRLRRA